MLKRWAKYDTYFDIPVAEVVFEVGRLGESILAKDIAKKDTLYDDADFKDIQEILPIVRIRQAEFTEFFNLHVSQDKPSITNRQMLENLIGYCVSIFSAYKEAYDSDPMLQVAAALYSIGDNLSVKS